MTEIPSIAPLPSEKVVTFGIVTGQHHLSWEALVEQWQLAEEAGFDSLWLFDHFLALYDDPEGDTLEASTLLAGLAAKTRRARISVLVYGNTHRNPAILAKEITTVDHISGGRVILGIGAAWNEPEHTMYDIPFPTPGDRVGMLDESLTAMESFFTKPRTTFEGKYYAYKNAPFSPKPVQAKLPVLIGGKRPKMLQVIARHADIWDAGGTPEEVAIAGDQIDRHCVEIGRAPGSVIRGVSLGADRIFDAAGFERAVRDYHAVGVRQFLFDFPITSEGIDIALGIARDLLPSLRAEFAE
jgi:alkanesulfonate monooxygenase SsuD/methylene tetrahydromethanopterin reductase-like flavin-dependent oxidoreductase (luciferase family)